MVMIRPGKREYNLEVIAEIDSTNSELLRRSAPARGQATVLRAERQTAGRGRRGRSWLAVPGEVLCLSVGWTFSPIPQDLSALTLTTGVCIAHALARLGVRGVALKWPNDLIAGNRKLGGILIETRMESNDAVYAVIGVGMNLALTDSSRAAIHALGTQPVDVRELADPCSNDLAPNIVAAHMIESMIEGAAEFARVGFREFFESWTRLDSLRGAPIVVQHGTEKTRGIARGIDLSGALLVETPRALERFISGDVSVRVIE
jgi:BirA family biotin operon repressor/biotin-[acetyl-CoA-carboxylase] ligase